MKPVTVIGGGLAGSEAAWQAAERGAQVRLVEMRPAAMTPAHRTGDLAELVCSNSLGSQLPDRASGILQSELGAMSSLLYRCARSCRVPAGGALAVDRTIFADQVTRTVSAHPRIGLERTEADVLPDEGIVVIAAGPLASPLLVRALSPWTEDRYLYFYDAIAPVVRTDSIDRDRVFRASRHGRGEREDGDYLNCPLDAEGYAHFVRELAHAERIPLHAFEGDIERGVRAGEAPHFEGCLPVEVLAGRGEEALAFGPMRPVGLDDPSTGRWPRAVVQLRQEDAAGEYHSLVGFQTNLREREQERVFRRIPGLESAVFVRFGRMHRNTFINGPHLLRPTLQLRGADRILVAGQLAGFEGYAGSIATGLVAGWNAACLAASRPPVAPPPETMTGALLHAVACGDPRRFQPVKANLGLLPPLPPGRRMGRRERAGAHAARADAAMKVWLEKAATSGSSALPS